MPQYLRQPDGTLVMTEEPTRSHPQGDAPRQADGAVIGTDGLVMQGAEAEPVAAPAARRTRRKAPTPEAVPEPPPSAPGPTETPLPPQEP